MRHTPIVPPVKGQSGKPEEAPSQSPEGQYVHTFVLKGQRPKEQN